MLYFFVTERNYNPPLHFLHTKWGKPFRNSILPLSYPWAYNISDFSGGIFLFSDLDIMTSDEMAKACKLADRISRQKESHLIINDPRRALSKVEVLKTLYKKGINEYQAYTISEYRQIKRFPVFLKATGNHGGPQSQLLFNLKEVEQVIAKEQLADGSDDFYFVEHLSCDKSHGYRTKYSYFKFGAHLFPRHVFFSKDWMIKTRDRLSPKLAQIEHDFLVNNPHYETIQKVFDVSNLDYGRVDYSLLNGKPQIWEINTNPNWALIRYQETPFKKKLHEIFYRLFTPKLKETIDLFPSANSRHPFLIPQLYHQMQFMISDIKERKKIYDLSKLEQLKSKASRLTSSLLRKAYPVRR